ncbi:MAG TPA: S9 family peptidase [Leadbetterella sp.]|nr:S9 family peptidase [Leadbetterella sp.]
MRKILFLLLLAHFSFAQTEKIQVTDLTKIKNVVSIVTNNDKAIYALKTIEPTPDKPLEFDYITNLYLINLQNPSKHIALTRGNEGASQPALSPDGKSVAFVRTVKDKSQIFIMPLEGGEPWQLTTSKYGSSSPQFSPDGKRILFSSSLSLNEILTDSIFNAKKELPSWSFEKPGFKSNDFLVEKKGVKANPDGNIEEIRAYLNKDVVDKKAKVLNRLNFQGEATVEPEMRFSHIFEIDILENAKAKAITSGYWSFQNVNYAPDGKRIIATTAKDATQHPDREQENKIISIDLASLKQTTIYEKEGKSFGGLSLSPTGAKIALVMNAANVISHGQLSTINSDGTGFKEINFDRVPNSMTWSADEKSLYFVANSNGGVPVFKLDVTSGKVDRLTDFESGIGSLELVNPTKAIFAKNDVSNPHEIYVSDLTFKNQTKISDINTPWVKNKKLSYPEKRTFKNSAGQEIEFWIMKPTDFVAGKKYPLLLQMHGGPTAMWGPGEASMWHELQYFAAQGYGVVFPNQRGSGGYGKDFQFSNYRDWGKGPQEDALGATSIAAKEAWVDTSKQVITGGSYAGYLTAWIIAHDHRFKAAFAQRGVYDLTTFMGEGNAWRLTPNYFGLPWDDEAKTKIDANSPYTFVDKIKTPLLIKHGENDLRTGVIQSEMMFKSLKYLEKEVEYVRMPGGTHELSRTGNVRQRIDRILRIYEFFERYISTK